jgi:hypothetical protein
LLSCWAPIHILSSDFFPSILLCNQNGDQPYEDLAKYGYNIYDFLIKKKKHNILI